MSGFLCTNAELNVHICRDALGRGKRGGGWDIRCRQYMVTPTPSSLPSTQLNPHSSLPLLSPPQLYPQNAYLTLTTHIRGSALSPLPLSGCVNRF